MVFCGKPSKACLCCRKRRIKCAQKLPACTQCIRVDKICPGYRDQLELYFRDENEKILRKANCRNNPCIVKVKRSPQDGKARVNSSPVTRLPAKASDSMTELKFGNPAISNLSIIKNWHPLNDKGIIFFLTYFLTVPLERSQNWVDLTPTISVESFVQRRTLEANPNLMVIARKKHSDTVSFVIRELGDIVNANIVGLMQNVVMLIICEISVDIHEPRNNSNNLVDKRCTPSIAFTFCAFQRWLKFIENTSFEKLRGKQTDHETPVAIIFR
ncbi:hypothetical protein EAF00_000563 [Botryotinia globosa]|nr:hypothetical protein EAF00_000563 [Botryotinia globosa]